MKLVNVNFHPEPRQLRQFGLVALVAMPLLCWLWSGGSQAATAVGAALGVGCGALGLVFPRGLKPVFILLSLVAYPIGFVVSELLILIVFVGLFVPVGLVFRLLRRDVLKLGFDPQAETYWQPKRQPTDVTSYLRQW